MPGGNPGIPEAESGNFIWSRRDILSLAGWGAILTCFAAAGGAILRLLFPRVLFEPPTSFKAGYPTEYTVGDVSEKWMKSQRRSEEHTSELQSLRHLVCRLLLEKK